MPVVAQTARADDTVAKVQTDGGVIMISQDGEFETAVAGQRVKPNARLMVSEESAATVVYDNGCKQQFDKPGVYEISATCALPVLATAGVSTGVIAAAVVGGGAFLAVVLDDKKDTRLPVSR